MHVDSTCLKYVVTLPVAWVRLSALSALIIIISEDEHIN